MRNSLKSVDNGTAEVVGRIDLPFISTAVMRLWIATVDDRVAHRLVWIVDGHLRADTPLHALLVALLHLLETGQIVFYARVAPSTRNTIHALCTHLLL